MRLSIDLSNRSGSLALHTLGPTPTLKAAFSLEGENKHSELLLGSLKDFLEKNEVVPIQLKELVSSSGPGSFTGLRIAVSTLKGFSMAWGIPFYLINGSEARARAYKKRFPEEMRELVVVTKVASQSYAVAKLKDLFIEDETFEPKNLKFTDQRVLVDTAETQSLIPGSEIFPIQAEYLGENLEHAQNRIEAKNFEDLIRATPHYYGSSRF